MQTLQEAGDLQCWSEGGSRDLRAEGRKGCQRFGSQCTCCWGELKSTSWKNHVHCDIDTASLTSLLNILTELLHF
jgi:hypothetical protein